MFITSDLHFYHKKIIEYCNRTYHLEEGNKEQNWKELQKMNEDILSEFDKLPTASTILNLGDLVVNSRLTFEDVKYLVDKMKTNNKHLWIVLGNHDRTLPRYLKSYDKNKSAVELFYELGFEIVFPEPIVIGNYTFSHEPVEDCDKNIIGHIHNTLLEDCGLNRSNYFNACWDEQHKFVQIDEIEKYFYVEKFVKDYK